MAVLRSPLVGLTLDELALVRLALPRGRFGRAPAIQRATTRWCRISPGIYAALQCARESFAFLSPSCAGGSWPARPLSQCLETILDDTHYEDWLLTQSRGTARRVNVQRLSR